METKKIASLFLIFSFIFLSFIIYFSGQVSKDSNNFGCNPSVECQKVERALTITHIGFGFFGFMFGMGFYLLFFNKTEERILKRLEETKEEKLNNERFYFILKALDPFERRVMKGVREHEGITQNILRLRTDMSKAKLSYVLKELEKRNLVKRVKKGKTFEIFLKI